MNIWVCKEDGHVKTEAKIEVMLPQTEGHLGPLETGKGSPREHGPANVLILDV